MRYTIIATVVALAIGHEVCAGNVVLYVEDDAPPNGDGASWDTAFRFLQDALAVASEPENGIGLILVAEGTYVPDRDETHPDGTGDREASFQLPNGVALLGGFPGVGAENASARDAGLYETILSGDLLGDDGAGGMNIGENSYHVVTIENATADTRLEGVTVASGNAENADTLGAGILVEGGAPRIDGCLIKANHAEDGAAGMWISDSGALVSNCEFEDNAGAAGAAVIVTSGGTTLEACLFRTNVITNPTGQGGALVLTIGTMVVADCEFYENEAAHGGAIYTSSATVDIHNCLFTENVALGDGGAIRLEGGAVTVSDCQFIGNEGDAGGAVRLSSGSHTISDCDFDANQADEGGAIFYEGGGTALLLNCRFNGNEAIRGGAAYHEDDVGLSVPVYLACDFTANHGGAEGGAIYNDRNCGLVLACTFDSNTGGHGACVFNSESDTTMLGSVFQNNHATGDGGALVNAAASEPTFIHCTFLSNSTLCEGGVLANWDSAPRFLYCRMIGNTANREGGAMWSDESNTTFENCLFSGNETTKRGGAIYGQGNMTVTLTNCTLAGNQAAQLGGGIINDDVVGGGHITLKNCILWGNMDAGGRGESAQVRSARGEGITIDYSDIEGWTGRLGGIGNIGIDPVFVDADGPDDEVGTEDDNLQLLGGSPCIDAADSTFVSDCAVDLAIAERLFDDPDTEDTGAGRAPIADMGAFEFASPLAADCNLNGLIDLCDIAAGDAVDCNGNLVPDECDIASGVSSDCNLNGVPDACDVNDGAAFDCDGNGVLDSCDLVEGAALDCNANGIPDSCDIAAGASFDCNENGVPDECETMSVFTAESGELSPIDGAHPQQFTVFAPPSPTGPVEVTVTAAGDFSGDLKDLIVKLNGVTVEVVFDEDGELCADPPDIRSFKISIEMFESLVGDDHALFTLVGSFWVDPEECSFASLALEYPVEPQAADENRNMIPDECEIPGDLDGDGKVGTSDLILLLGAWGRCDDCQDCLGDIDGDCAVGTSDLIILLGNWG